MFYNIILLWLGIATRKAKALLPATIIDEAFIERQIKMEIWKDIKGYKGKYQVSNQGRVKSVQRKRECRVRGGKIAIMTIPEKILKQWNRGTYFLIDLWKNKKREVRSVHHLVFEAFIGKIKMDMMIHHKDENKFNNSVENLEMLSCQTHNRIHHAGKPSWNKGKKMPPEVHKKAWETRRKKIWIQLKERKSPIFN